MKAHLNRQWRGEVVVPDFGTCESLRPACRVSSIKSVREERSTSAKFEPQKAALPGRWCGLRAAINGTQKALLPGDRLSGSEGATPPALQ
jgi:hypothetical protein